jgi:hypothetical protein
VRDMRGGGREQHVDIRMPRHSRGRDRAPADEGRRRRALGEASRAGQPNQACRVCRVCRQWLTRADSKSVSGRRCGVRHSWQGAWAAKSREKAEPGDDGCRYDVVGGSRGRSARDAGRAGLVSIGHSTLSRKRRGLVPQLTSLGSGPSAAARHQSPIQRPRTRQRPGQLRTAISHHQAPPAIQLHPLLHHDVPAASIPTRKGSTCLFVAPHRSVVGARRRR